MDFKLSGNWSGKMMDAEGFSALASLQLEMRANEIKGNITFTLIDDETSDEQRGEVVGKVDDSGGIFLQYMINEQSVVSFQGRLFEVRHHARSAFGGIYSVIGPEQEPVAGGVALFWLYLDQSTDSK